MISIVVILTMIVIVLSISLFLGFVTTTVMQNLEQGNYLIWIPVVGMAASIGYLVWFFS